MANIIEPQMNYPVNLLNQTSVANSGGFVISNVNRVDPVAPFNKLLLTYALTG